MSLNKTEKEVIKKLESQLEFHNLPINFYEMIVGNLKIFKYKVSKKDCFPLCMSIMKVKQNTLKSKQRTSTTSLDLHTCWTRRK